MYVYGARAMQNTRETAAALFSPPASLKYIIRVINNAPALGSKKVCQRPLVQRYFSARVFQWASTSKIFLRLHTAFCVRLGNALNVCAFNGKAAHPASIREIFEF
jgi:hypothetical protein